MRPSWRQALALQTPVLVAVGAFLAIPGSVLLLASLSAGEPFRISLGGWTSSNFSSVLSDSYYRTELLRSLSIGAQTTFWSTIGGFILAYWIRFRATRKNVWLLLVAVSLIASYIVRIYAWRTLLGPSGAVASVLSLLRLAKSNQSVVLFTPTAVVLAQVQVFLPFTSLILASSLAKIDERLLEQARILGYGVGGAFWNVTLPLTGRALLGALCFTFFLSTGDFLTPALLGGVNGTTLGAVIAAQFQQVGNYASGAALSFVMLLLFFAVFVVLRTLMRALGMLPRQ